MRSVQHVSTGGAWTVLGDRFPLCSSKKPQSLADTELQGLWDTVWVPILLKSFEGCPCSPQKAIVSQGWCWKWDFCRRQGLGSAGDAHRGCVSEAAVSEPA